MKAKLLKFTDVLIGKVFCLILGYLDYFFDWTEKDPAIPKPKKILVIRPGGVGDFLYLLPALKALKDQFPGAEIHVLAEKRNRQVKELTDTIDRLLIYDARPFLTWLELRRNVYDIVIDSEQFHNFSALFAYRTRSKVRIGFKTNPFRNHLYTHLIEYSLQGSEPEEFLKLLEPLEIKVGQITFPIKMQAVPANKIVVALRGGDRYRYWEPEKYREVVSCLLKDPGRSVVLVGGESEREIAGNIMKAADPRVTSLVSRTSLAELARVIMESELFIGGDSGVAILAQVLGKKSIIIFGPTDERKWARGTVVRAKLPCAPCYLLGSYKFCRNIDCLKDISAEDVIAAVRALGF